jgi:hypothetical protein
MINDAAYNECNTIVQLGDFGYWEHEDGGGDYLDVISHQARSKNVEVYWIDGNHENHALLRQQYTIDGFTEIRPSLYYVPRGTTWDWDGVTFMGFGGAYSIDKNSRTEGVSWWPEEVANQQEIDYAIAAGKVDILFSHDCPNEYDIAFQMHIQRKGFRTIQEAADSRKIISQVVNVVKPRLIYHGHYHIRYSDVFEIDDQEIKITGLAHDWAPNNDSYMYLELEHIKERYL